MKKLLFALSIASLLTACDGGGSQNPDTQDTESYPSVGAVLPDQVNSNTLDVSVDFVFATARSVEIDFDIPTAKNSDATVSICTDFQSVALEFEIDFDSCTIHGILEAGVFSNTMKVTNDKESVVAIVLFQDAEIVPLYKEFTLDASQRTKPDGSMQSIIVWR